MSLTPDRHIPRDLAAYQVLAPNRRAAHALGVEPMSIEDLARTYLDNTSLLVATELSRHRTLQRALEEQWNPPDLTGTLRVVVPTVREVLRTGLDTAPGSASASSRWQRIVAVALRYRELLRSRHQVDPAEVLWVAAEHVKERHRILVVGYPRLGHAESAFLTAASAAGSLIVLPGTEEEAATDWSVQGWSVERSTAPGAGIGERLAARFAGHMVATPEASAWRFPSQESEVRRVLADVKQLLLDGVSSEDIVLVARDDAMYGPLIAHVAWEYELPVYASYGVSLRDTRVGAWLSTLADVVRGGAPFELTARLLSHPLGAGMDAEAWAAARREHPHGVEAWQRIDARAGHLRWPASAARDDHHAQLERLIAAFGLSERAECWRSEALALVRFRTAATGLRDSADETISRDQFLLEVLELLGLLSVSTGVGKKGIALHTPLALFGARYAHVYVLGAAEGVLPAPVGDDATLDFYERDRLFEAGWPIERAGDAARREDRSFEALLRSVGRAITICAPLSIDGRERIASPYFDRLGLEPVQAPSVGAASVEEARRARLQQGAADDPVLEGAVQAWTVEVRRESAAPPDHHDGVTGIPYDAASHSFSASQLVTLGQCPFKWFAQRLLGLAEPDEAEEDLSMTLRGQLWHATLEYALARSRGAAKPRTAALDALGWAFARAEREVRVPHTATWPQRREEHLSALRKVLKSEDFFPKDHTVLLLEQRFETSWRGLKVTGYVDRIDRTPDGLRLYDYKTRASRPDGAKNVMGEAKLDVQLPLYVQAAAPALVPGAAVAGAVYYSLTKAQAITAEIDEEALDALVARVHEQLGSGSFPVAPDIAGKACTYCDFDAICRRGPRLDRKRLEGVA